MKKILSGNILCVKMGFVEVNDDHVEKILKELLAFSLISGNEELFCH